VIEQVLEAMVDVVFVVDIEGRIVHHNAAAEALSGYSSAELATMSIAQLLDDGSSGIRTASRKRIANGDVMRRELSWLLAKGGERIPMSTTGAPVLGELRELKGIVLVGRDTRERQRLLDERDREIELRRTAEDELRSALTTIEERLESTRTQLLLAERRSTLGTLAGGVGHELRNIAQIQIGAVDELRIGLEAGEPADALVSTILPDLVRVSEHIKTHGQRLMQLARPGPDHAMPLDLRDVVNGVIAMLEGAGKLHRRGILAKLGHDASMVTVNRTRIEQIMVNLVLNAAYATKPGTGTITVEVDRHALAGRVVCSVSDNGVGIAPDDLAKIFEPFFTTKPEELGTGLGLFVAKAIVESYGGQLRAQSTIGRGTTFTFDLPGAA
jgi:two-component system NtrC family sensor kinase